MIAHHFTIDLEEYFQVSAFEDRVARSQWERFESRVAGQVARLLDVTVAATAAHHDKVWWHARRHFGAVLLDAFYGEPVGPTATAYLARYLDKATGAEAGAA